MSNKMTKRSVQKSIIAFVVAIALAASVLAAFVLAPTRLVGAAANGFVSEFDTKAEMTAASLALNERIAEEGMVLLTNEDNALPLANNSRVTVFGHAARAPVQRSGGDHIGENDPNSVQFLNPNAIFDSLTASGLVVNPAVRAAAFTGGNDWAGRNSFYDVTRTNQAIRASYQTYSDAAIVVLRATAAPSRFDGRDVTEAQAWPHGNMHEEGSVFHNRGLDRAQFEILAEATAHFETVIVLINDTITMELGWLNYNEVVTFGAVRDANGDIIDGAGGRTFNQEFSVDFSRIKAGMIIGVPGVNGFGAVGRLLRGTANPSGRLVDVYANNFQYNPTWFNSGHNLRQYGGAILNPEGNPMIVAPAFMGFMPGGPASNRTDYQEGIFMGMHYYETRAYDEMRAVLTAEGVGAGIIPEEELWAWWYSHVAFPFGHGLSYTTFNWAFEGAAPYGAMTATSSFTFNVRVTNTGDIAGREVVQMYYTAPWVEGGIEKAHVVLAGFEKTDILAPGASQVLTFTLDARDMASYDWNNVGPLNLPNGGYVLSAGDYQVRFMRNSHARAEVLSTTFNIAAPIHVRYAIDGETVIENQFNDVNEVILARAAATVAAADRRVEFSRSNWEGTFPTPPTINNMTMTEAEHIARFDILRGAAGNRPDAWQPEWDIDQPWYVEASQLRNFAVASGTGENAIRTLHNGTTVPNTPGAQAPILLHELTGADLYDARWDTLIDYMTLEEALVLTNLSGYMTHAVNFVGKPRTMQSNGPDSGWRGGGLPAAAQMGQAPVRFASPVTIASTWSPEVAYLMGKMIAEIGLWGNSDSAAAGDNANVFSYNGWYAPTVNLMRSPFPLASRVEEMYSSDPFLSGMIAANIARGVRELGGYVYMKHFAVHENGNAADGFRGGLGLPSDQEGRRTGLSIWVNEQALREVYLWAFELIVRHGGAQAVMTTFSRIGYMWGGGSYALLTQVLRREWGFRGKVLGDIQMHGFLVAQQWIRAGKDANLTTANTFAQGAGANWAPNGQRLWGDGTHGAGTGVMTVEGANTPTQIMNIRRAVRNILYVTANSNAMQAPLGAAIRFSNPSIVSRTATTGEEFSLNLRAPLRNTQSANINNIAGWTGFDWNTRNTGNLINAPLNFESVTGLPAGLTMETGTGANAGLITGTPTGATGVYEVEVTVSATGFIPYTATITIVVLSDAETLLHERIAELERLMAQMQNSFNQQVNDLIAAWITAALAQGNPGMPMFGVPATPAGLIRQAIDSAVAGLQNAEQVNALIAAAVSAALGDAITTEQVESMITTALAGYLTTSQVEALIEGVEGSRLTAAQVQAIVDAAPYLNTAEVQALIDAALAAHECTSGGCGGFIGSSGSVTLAIVLGLALVGVLLFALLRKKKVNDIK